jgi:tRNA-specific 2-thiouridylase
VQPVHQVWRLAGIRPYEGFDYLATGHYAIITNQNGVYALRRGADQAKDQSYFLYILNQHRLKRLLFPLGEMTKTGVKKLAAAYGIDRLVRPDESQDICFVPGGNYAALIYKEQAQPGDIVDATGHVLGRHRGLGHYTIGQRRGLEIASAEPLYVTRLDAERNRVVVGPRRALCRRGLLAGDVNWVSGQPPSELNGISARIRYRSPEVAASIIILHNTVQVDFASPQWGVAPGQSVVFYRGQEVLGGGIIQD